MQRPYVTGRAEVRSILCRIAAVVLTAAGQASAAADSPSRDDVVRWGNEVTARIETRFLIPGSALYREKEGQCPAFMWSCGVELSALVAAAKVAPDTYRPKAKKYARALKSYWHAAGPVPGLDVLPQQKAPDRYYDDNAWIVLDLMDLYSLTREDEWLAFAEDTLRFVLSGEDGKLGGGLYWREQKKESKNTCANAPAIVGALRVYQATRKQPYLDAAQRLYPWTRAHLQDQDGLFWDNIALNGKVVRTQYTYNSALMIQASLAFYDLTKDDRFLREAKRVGRQSLGRWCRPDGRIDDTGRFAHLLLGAFVNLSRHDTDPVWRETVLKTLGFLHSRQRDEDGLYAGHWGKPLTGKVEKTELLDQASVARAFWEAAGLGD